MNEQEISSVVQAVLEGMKNTGSAHKPGHVCKCKKYTQRASRNTCLCETGGLCPIMYRMTLDTANALIQKVREKAEEMGVQAVVAVADQAGRPVAVQSMDGAYIASFDIALNKSFTSASLKMSTEALSHLSQPGQSLYGIQFTNDGKIVIFGGGEVLEADGKMVGAIGVSGGTAEQDTELAAYGREVFKEVIACL